MGFVEDLLSPVQSVSDTKYHKSSVPNSPIESICSQFSKTTTSLHSITCDSAMPKGVQDQSLNLESIQQHQPTTAIGITRVEDDCPEMICRRRASLERLLGMLYEDSRRRISSDADVATDSSHFSDCSQRTTFSSFTEQQLQQLDCESLKERIKQMRIDVEYANMKLLKALKQRTHQASRQTTRYDIITAVLQALSQKRSVDTKLQFSLEAPSTESGFQEWLNAMKALTRLPDGIPNYFRRKLWITLADYYIDRLGIDWEHTRKVAFSEKINPDDDRLSFQIIKDLHRTGWSGICGEAERIHLKRVLLGYARYNKVIGYCQGFNVIAALVLEVTDFKEECALKIMIFLIEQVLPQGYFDQSLRALSVDMAVLRTLLHQRLPKTARHLNELQRNSGESEPPLSNVFSMHWFLTLFATCLPKTCVYRLWDALVLEGSEVLLRASLAIWAKLSKKILQTTSTDHFYTLMGTLCQKLTEMRKSEIDNFISIVYTMSEFPYPGIAELRNRFAWNVESHPSTFTQFHKQQLHFTDDDASDSEHALCVNCNSDGKPHWGAKLSDMAALQKQYKLLRQRQKQAAIVFQAAYEEHPGRLQNSNISSQQRKLSIQTTNDTSNQRTINDSEHASEIMFNHLYLGALLVGFRENDQKLEPPMYTTMNGTVPVTSTIVQPIGDESIKNSRRFGVNNECVQNTFAVGCKQQREQQQSEHSKANSLTVDTCTVISPQEELSTIDMKGDSMSELTFDIEFDDNEAFLHQFVKTEEIASFAKSSVNREESSPARMLTSGDNENSAIMKSDDNCELQRTTSDTADSLQFKDVNQTHNEPTIAPQGVVTANNSHFSKNPSTSVPLKMTLIVTNNEKPQVHTKRSSINLHTNNTHLPTSSSSSQPGKQSQSASKKNVNLRRSLAVLEKLSNQPQPIHYLSSNPFPVIHKSLRST